MFQLQVNNDIKLRLLEIHDASAIFQLIDQDRLYLREWLPWIDLVLFPQQYSTIIPIWHKQYAENKGFEAGIFYKDKLVGMISLQQVDWQNRQASIGYFLASSAQGKGIMTNTVAAVLNYAFYYLNLNRIEIRCGLKNKKSMTIPEKLLFTKEGVIREGEFLYDHYHDLVLFSMLEKEWQQLHRKK
ncbi:GNAT family N-acetyltransferase [Niallia nealsonii]|uniref:RimJ/RimL family protein N-acetyltransferase n=1 Tax=Niallia nealsonii TaxID=115979 RepID=A0A2N0Z7B6_9BACI|nr:GNAT family protein [Niallia nealsonii]PKG25408.1 RimJ/RimL family protein N-acetyltransferase [Niallia nealsonii]